MPQMIKETKPDFLGSLWGILLGLALVIIVAPMIMWYAESQTSAQGFQSARAVSASSSETGNIWIQGAPSTSIECPLVGNCIYYSLKVEELQDVEKDWCGTLPKDAQVISNLDQKCDDDGKCQPCYHISVKEWKTTDTKTDEATFNIGSYQISNLKDARRIGEETKTETSESKKETVQYLPEGKQYVVSGNAQGGQIFSGNPFVVSTMSYEKTLAELGSQDVSMGWVLRIAGFLALFFGFMSILGPITFFGDLIKKIPWVGQYIGKGINFVVTLVSLIISIAFFIVYWIVIMVLKNILWIILIAALIFAGFYVYNKYLKK